MREPSELTLHSGGISRAVTLRQETCSIGECRICSKPQKVVRGKLKYTLRARKMAHTSWTCGKKKCKQALLRELIKLLARDTSYTKKQIKRMLRQP